jgi:hypothetical protein
VVIEEISNRGTEQMMKRLLLSEIYHNSFGNKSDAQTKGGVSIFGSILKRSIIICLGICAISVGIGVVLLSPSSVKAQTPTLSVNASTGKHPISPYIYGMAYGPGIPRPDIALAKVINLPMGRWGGDGASNYNGAFDSFNSGLDNYFLQGYLTSTGPYSQADYYLDHYRAVAPRTQELETIPINPWVTSSSKQDCSYSNAKYAPPGGWAYSVVWPTPGRSADACSGNSVPCVSGTPPSCSTGPTIAWNNAISGNMIPNTPTIQETWIAHNISKYGNCASGGICYYQLDNEPNGWSNTHRDWQPKAAGYATITKDGEMYATAIKTADPTAKVLGPSDFGGWGWVNESPTPDPAVVYYLKEFAAYDQAHGTRSLDYLDEHYGIGDASGSIQQDFDAVRSWWDPTYRSPNGQDGYFAGYNNLGFGPQVQFIPRMYAYINAYYPGLQLTVSEVEVQHYKSGAFPAIKGAYFNGSSVIDALVLADAIGIWGSYNLQLVNLFDYVGTGDAESFTYMLYRNYDGAGGQFGNTSITASSSNPTLMSVYGALRSSDGKMTVIVVNKESTPYTTTLSISGFEPTTSAVTRTYSSANTGALVAGTATVGGGNTVNYTFPAYSATEFIFTPSLTSTVAPPTDLVATVK